MAYTAPQAASTQLWEQLRRAPVQRRGWLVGWDDVLLRAVWWHPTTGAATAAADLAELRVLLPAGLAVLGVCAGGAVDASGAKALLAEVAGLDSVPLRVCCAAADDAAAADAGAGAACVRLHGADGAERHIAAAGPAAQLLAARGVQVLRARLTCAVRIEHDGGSGRRGAAVRAALAPIRAALPRCRLHFPASGRLFAPGVAEEEDVTVAAATAAPASGGGGGRKKPGAVRGGGGGSGGPQSAAQDSVAREGRMAGVTEVRLLLSAAPQPGSQTAVLVGRAPLGSHVTPTVHLDALCYCDPKATNVRAAPHATLAPG
jgi:hypothetical protein